MCQNEDFCNSILIFILGDKINPQNALHCYIFSLNPRSVVKWPVSVHSIIVNCSFTMLHPRRTVTDECNSFVYKLVCTSVDMK